MSFMQRLFTACAATLLAFSAQAFAQTANVQVIHNSADPAAAVVDIYINDNKPDAFDDFAFRNVSPFLPLPAGPEIIVKIAAADSDNAADKIIATISLGSLVADQNYVVVANGVLNEGFTNGGDASRVIDFNLYTSGNARQLSTGGPGFVDVAVFHGVTDAPAVDVYADINGEPLFSNLDYGQYSDYITLPASDDYVLTVTVAGNKDAVVDRFLAPLATADRAAAVVCASGFATPGDEPGMPSADEYSFGLLVPFPFGGGVMLPNDLARVQVVHNASVPAAATVDIYVNGVKPDVLDDFAYRTATPFLDVPAGIDVTVTVAGPGSTGPDDAVIATVELGELTDGESYVAIANGIVGEGFTNPDPDNRSIAFTIYPLAGQESTDIQNEVAVNVFHGATDAPAVDVYADIAAEPLIPNLDYGNATGYVGLAAVETDLTVTAAGNSDVVVGTFIAPLEILGGSAITVMASGFLTPADEAVENDGTYDFALLAVLPNGVVVPLQMDVEAGSAQVQVIHNSSLPLAATVDVYVNGQKPEILDDFAYRTATPYLDLPSDVDVTVVIAAATSTSVSDQVLGTFELGQLTEDADYVLIANGIAGDDFNNGGGMERDISLNLFPLTGRSEGSSATEVDINIFHGVTDAPAVDIYTDFSAAAPTVPALDYGMATDYITVPAAPLNTFITAAGSKETYVGGYQFNLTGLGGGSAVVLATGFLSPNDEPGPPPAGYEFGLIAVLADGTVVTPDMVSSVTEEAREIESASVNIMPNPVADRAELTFVMSETTEVRIVMTDARGSIVAEIDAGLLPIGQQNMNLPIQNLTSGAYSIVIMTATGAQQTQLNVVR